MATYAGVGSFVPAGSVKTIHAGRGSILKIIASGGGSRPVALHDGSNVSASVLFRLHVPAGGIADLEFPEGFPLRFSTGLTVDAGDCDVSLIVVGT